MITINNQKVEWQDAPKGWFLTDVKMHVLWQHPETGAMFVLIKVPKGSVWELPHRHPQANQMGFTLLGQAELPNGSKLEYGDGKYSFEYRPKGTTHGPPKGSTMKITEDAIALQYYDGPPTKIFEGETRERPLDGS